MDGENIGEDQFRRALNSYIELMREYHELDESKTTGCIVDVLEARASNAGIEPPEMDWTDIEVQ